MAEMSEIKSSIYLSIYLSISISIYLSIGHNVDGQFCPQDFYQWIDLFMCKVFCTDAIYFSSRRIKIQLSCSAVTIQDLTF